MFFRWLWDFILLLWNFLFGGAKDEIQCPGNPGCVTQQVLKEFSNLHGQDSYDAWSRIRKCLQDTSSSDIDLLDASDAMWRSFVSLGQAAENGWGVNDAFWNEYDPTPLSGQAYVEAQGILVAEPCNAVSNFAYYRAAVELCESDISFDDEDTVPALITSLASLAFGSTFFHSARTYTSFLADNVPIDMVSFIAYQAAIANLPSDQILSDLQESPLNATAIYISNQLLDIFTSGNTSQWDARMEALPTYIEGSQFYQFAFTGLVGLALELVFGGDITEFIAGFLIDLLSPQSRGFFLNEFLPILRQALVQSNVKLSLAERGNLFLLGLGTFIKFVSDSSDTHDHLAFIPQLYAFLWQERVIESFLATDPVANHLGAKLGFVVNGIANALTRFNRRDALLQLQIDVYPGDGKCRAEQGHSKWHELSANGLVDLVYLAESLNRIIGSTQSRESETPLTSLSILTNCEELEDTSVIIDDDTRMKNWADCVVTSTPILSCGRDCVLKDDLGLCFWECFQSLDS